MKRQLQNASLRSVTAVLGISEPCQQLRLVTMSSKIPFSSLIPSVTLSVVLLVSHGLEWTATGDFYHLVSSNRATAQLMVQIASNLLGFANLLVICRIINYDTRALLSVKPISLIYLRFWNAIISQQFTWDLPPRLLIPLGLWLLFAMLPSALWAGAITPVTIIVNREVQIALPSYANTTLLTHDWKSRLNLPSVRDKRGIFAYNVGETFLGPLLQSASEATTIDGGTDMRPKMDYTSFEYVDRSYGVGMSVGLTDGSIIANPHAQNYWYLETGYNSVVQCIYNESTAYHLESGGQPLVWKAKGLLPDSLIPENTSYISWSVDTIVAVAVDNFANSPRRILGIAAGETYKFLNTTQCETLYIPTMFNVSVELAGENITVTPLTSNGSVEDIEPRGNLTFLTNWQFALIASDQTSAYSSLLGTSFNTSISNYQSAQKLLHGATPSPQNATLSGLQNSITAMVDSMLTAYAGAQLMVANETTTTTAYVGVVAIRFGDYEYIVAVAILSLVVLGLFLIDLARTRAWKGLQKFDYMDPTDLILGMAPGSETRRWKMEEQGLDVENFMVSQTRDKLVLSSKPILNSDHSESGRMSVESLLTPSISGVELSELGTT